MDSFDNEKPNDNDEPTFAPQKADSYQKYVFLAHLLLAIAISVLSFRGDSREWFAGMGVVTPIMLTVSVSLFAIMTGINWYREEFAPYMRRTLIVQEFEIDRFLQYKRIHRFSVLLAGYLTTIICQLVWFQVAGFVVLMLESVSSTSEVLYVVTIGMGILYLVVLAIFVITFSDGLKFYFSDIAQLIEVDDRIQESIKAKQKEEKERQEQEKKAKKKNAKDSVNN
ncbi:MAG: hypothetical protein ACFFDQ_13210 [Candidatus Thorarchaeota archaeon]